MSKLFLIFGFCLISAKSCPDRSALNKIDVWVHRIVNERGEKYASININELDAYRSIDVTKANVSVLCDGMIRMFPLLEQLTLIDVNLTEIKPEAFQQVPRLKLLSLAVNNLTNVKKEQFKNLKALEILYLSSNKIDNVDEDAFSELVNLKKVFLDRNRIYEINSQWFLKNLELSLIDLSFNSISKLQKRAFTLPKNSNVEIRLRGNQIEALDENVAMPLGSGEEEPYLILHLERNHIQTIPVEFLESLDKLNSNIILNSNYIEDVSREVLMFLKVASISLHIEENPLTCEAMDKLKNFLADHELRATFYYNTTLECSLHGLNPQW